MATKAKVATKATKKKVPGIAAKLHNIQTKLDDFAAKTKPMDAQDLEAWTDAKERPDPDRVKFILDHATPVTLDLPADLPFADWQAIIASLKNMGRSMAWWIGDCLY